MSPKTAYFLERRIIEIYLEMQKEWKEGKRSEPTAREVYQKLTEEQGKRIRPVPLPSHRTVQLILQKARPKLEEELEEDRPWSIAASVKHRLPAEATKDLLRLWKVCLALDIRLTVREAKWVAYLREVVDREDLLERATSYAIEERVSDIMGVPLDTRGSDGEIALSLDEQNVAQGAGILPLPLSYRSDESSDIARELETDKGDVLERVLQSSCTPGRVAELRMFPSREGRDLVEASIKDIGLSEKEDWLYAVALRRLARGAKWKSLPREKRLRMSDTLQNWARSLSDAILLDLLEEAGCEIYEWEREFADESTEGGKA